MFCLDCILCWLAAQLEELLGPNQTAALGNHLVDALRDPPRDPEAFVVAAGLVDILGLRFSCPSCRSVIQKKPIPAVAVEDIMRGLGMGDEGELGTVTSDRLCQANGAFERYLLF